ncbi:hypothetical protein B0J11DRAFT_544440 [Dendryphion nanum]|uniref:Uncharacterized protein n=1 Tax=Dendryphion nanum TaxID=256645 RepID=A0A9P9D0D8_9PLEO|nr:hypothetical protein B0J11DRAFT_544440 [Dendryphion nanum]
MAYLSSLGPFGVPFFNNEAEANLREGIRMRSYVLYSNRRLFRTKSGYIGLSFPEIEVGDFVCVFQGGNMPLTIRSVGNDELFLVGEAYV